MTLSIFKELQSFFQYKNGKIQFLVPKGKKALNRIQPSA